MENLKISTSTTDCYSEKRIIDPCLLLLILCHFCDLIMFSLLSLCSLSSIVCYEISAKAFQPVVNQNNFAFHLYCFKEMIKQSCWSDPCPELYSINVFLKNENASFFSFLGESERLNNASADNPVCKPMQKGLSTSLLY